MGELRLRGKTWWIRYYRGGRRCEESARTKKKSEAERLLKLREGAIARGELVSPAMARVTVDQALARVEADYQLKGQRSLADTKRRIKKHLLPFFGGRRLSSITSDDIAAYQMHRRAEGASPATVNRETAILRRAFTLQRKAGTVFAVPFFEHLREDNARQSFIEPSQLESLLKHLPKPLRPVVEFAYITGWRVRSEVLPLEWRHVDRPAGVIRLDPGTTKNNKPRVFAYANCQPIKDVIEAQWTAHETLMAAGTLCPLVFHRYGGQPIRDFVDAWRVACKKAGLAGKVPHDLRRSAVRNLVRAGVSTHTAMTITGHLTPEVFRRYDIISEADQLVAGEAIAGYLRTTESSSRFTSDRVMN